MQRSPQRFRSPRGGSRPYRALGAAASTARQYGPRIVGLGGGAGLRTLLRGLKEWTANLTAIVATADENGCSQLTQQMFVLPPEDIRECLIALSSGEPLLRQLFEHRFTAAGGSLSGHAFGSLALTALAEITGSFESAIEAAGIVLAAAGRVFPMTREPVQLVARLDSGQVAEGPKAISSASERIRQVALRPRDAQAPEGAVRAICDADLVVIGPGSLYTSVVPCLLPEGIRDALAATSALKVYVCNVLTHPGETDRYTVCDHLQALIDHAGPYVADYVLVNEELPARLPEMGRWVAAEPVGCDLDDVARMGVCPVAERLLDPLHPSRHQPAKLAAAITRLYEVHQRGRLQRGRRATT